MRKQNAISVLLLDDNADLVHLYKQQIQRLGPFRVTAQTEGSRARRLAERQLFDIVVIDAKLYYRGVEFGGLRLADDLRPRYGTNTILIISRFITAELMREYGAEYEFLEKSGSGRSTAFPKQLCYRIRQMQRRQYVFVAMPFDDEFDELYKLRIKAGVERAGFKCVRVDEVLHNRAIPEMIIALVEKSKLVVFHADGGNANAYYEAGFADAMRKEVVLVAREPEELMFDVAQRNTILYGTRPSLIQSELTKRIRSLRLAEPIGS